MLMDMEEEAMVRALATWSIHYRLWLLAYR